VYDGAGDDFRVRIVRFACRNLDCSVELNLSKVQFSGTPKYVIVSTRLSAAGHHDTGRSMIALSGKVPWMSETCCDLPDDSFTMGPR
jgi:hypothetical protein